MDQFKYHFIQSLQDGRSVWLKGKQIDVTKNENSQGTLARLRIYMTGLKILYISN